MNERSLRALGWGLGHVNKKAFSTTHWHMCMCQHGLFGV
ncbi:hypothetical protein HBZS_105700 [Helicobacter bizzozeronii CCUG 35545]|nr:hypothetical protein HBZS_105700 [Helicobacter bizzozeronii CCUG 35545]